MAGYLQRKTPQRGVSVDSTRSETVVRERGGPLAVDCCIPGHEGVSHVRLAQCRALARSKALGSLQVSDRLISIKLEIFF